MPSSLTDHTHQHRNSPSGDDEQDQDPRRYFGVRTFIGQPSDRSTTVGRFVAVVLCWLSFEFYVKELKDSSMMCYTQQKAVFSRFMTAILQKKKKKKQKLQYAWGCCALACVVRAIICFWITYVDSKDNLCSAQIRHIHTHQHRRDGIFIGCGQCTNHRRLALSQPSQRHNCIWFCCMAVCDIFGVRLSQNV